LDDYWLSLRLKEIEIPAAHLLRHAPSQNPESVLPTIVDALELYHRVKGENKKKTFFTHRQRSVDYLVQSIGCRSLAQYSSADAASFRDWLRNRGLSTGFNSTQLHQHQSDGEFHNQRTWIGLQECF
jgi:hypothetical protein